ncbi:MAG: hypothetical protein D3909_04000 [Candidatus Electrothrix sp. ATG1]|nr:hypothetical protein [Candidatus Electrothrix sp. ATG1]
MKLIKKLLQFCIASLFFLSGVSFIAWLILKVQKGEGTDLYFTGWGYKASPLAIFGLLFAMFLINIIGLICRYFYKKEERDFLEKYGKKDENTNV